MNFKQTIFFSYIVIIIGLAFKDYCSNQKDIDYFKSMIEQTTDGENYKWQVSPRCTARMTSLHR
jgi:hypothetical protein